jgi:hypothetical protein
MCYCRSGTPYFNTAGHIFEGFIAYLYITNLLCILVTRYKETFQRYITGSSTLNFYAFALSLSSVHTPLGFVYSILFRMKILEVQLPLRELQYFSGTTLHARLFSPRHPQSTPQYTNTTYTCSCHTSCSNYNTALSALRLVLWCSWRTHEGRKPTNQTTSSHLIISELEQCGRTAITTHF